MYIDKESLKLPWYSMAGNHDHRGVVDAQIEFGDIEPLWVFPSLNYTFTVVIQSFLSRIYKIYWNNKPYFWLSNWNKKTIDMD